MMGRSMSRISQISKGTGVTGMSSSQTSGQSVIRGRTRSVTLRDSEFDLKTEGERRILFEEHAVDVVPHSLNSQHGLQPNRIRTAKFTPLTWLPCSLYHQFRRIANVYFLCIALLVCFPWSPKRWQSKVFPFVGVLLWTALKDLYEDRRRMIDDKKENSRTSKRFDPSTKSFTAVPWEDLFVGDVLFIPREEAFPADLLLLRSATGDSAFISTVALDGESALKERKAPLNCHKALEISVSPTDICKADRQTDEEKAMHVLFAIHVRRARFKLAPPEAALWSLKGTMALAQAGEGTAACPVSEHNLLPRGCVLRNTDWILGVVAFVGEETKARLNSTKADAKFSQMQTALNNSVWGLLACLIFVCLYSATMSVLTSDEDVNICCSDDSWLIMFFKFCITYYHVVPLSLYVCFEMLKLMLGYQVNVDEQMRDPLSGEMALARTTDLIEELGQISFVFSDKTGTLTANEMIFAKCCVAGRDFGNFKPDAEQHTSESPGVTAVKAILTKSDAEAEQVRWFFTCLAICHSLQVEAPIAAAGEPAPAKDAPVVYTGMSPDEVALAEGARSVGVAFECRQSNKETEKKEVVFRGLSGQQVATLLYEFEFNSDRKRMSVLVRLGGQVHLITKGADNIMEKLLAEPLGEEAQILNSFAKEGLRTLIVASRRVEEDEFNKWQDKYTAACNTMDNSRDEKMAAVVNEMETSLHLCGITAVEDRLQDMVPEAIETLKAAGVRLWVLTGDKTETAVDIARSCRLFTNDTTLAFATGAADEEKALEILREAKNTLSKATLSGLVLDGLTIHFAMGCEAGEQLIYELGMNSRSCVCTRLSPKQKRELVHLVRRRSPSTVTLSIGDGANDVPMLEGAHVGIGIRGKEGAQAVQVSDVAISQFRFLVPLLLCHGRKAYRRIAVFLLFYLYKNVALAMGDVVWMHQNGYDGGIAFAEYLSVNYNIFFTSWHVLFVLAFDECVSDKVSVQYPELYQVGPSRQLFNARVFVKWMAFAVFHGCGAWLIPNLAFGGTDYSKTEPNDFWLSSCVSFVVIVLITCGKLLLAAESPWKPTATISTAVALLCLVVILILLGHTSIGNSMQPNMDSLPEKFFTRSGVFGLIMAAPAALLIPDCTEKAVGFFLWPSTLQTVRNKIWEEDAQVSVIAGVGQQMSTAVP